MDILAVKRVTLDLAGVAAVALHGINIGPVCSDHKTYMVGTAAIPVEEDHITGGYIRVVSSRPTPWEAQAANLGSLYPAWLIHQETKQAHHSTRLSNPYQDQ